MAMSPRLLRPRQNAHPEAAAWKSAVVANGGSVSASTYKAVETFCKAIDTAGIRSRFYRLNLFAGTGLNACLVPLYRGPSKSGTQYGNTTDTNMGLFVSGDYVETGASGGLLGNGTSKYLNTGVNASTSPPTNINQHLAAYCTAQAGSGSRFIIAANNSSSGGPGLGRLATGSTERFCTSGTTVDGGTSLLSGFLAGNADATNVSYYRNGTALATVATPSLIANNNDNIYVFAGNSGGTASLFSDRRLMAYSYGLGMSSSQWSAYNTAMQAFQTALGRNV